MPTSQPLPFIVFISPMAKLRLTGVTFSRDPSAEVAISPRTAAYHPWKSNSHPTHCGVPSLPTSIPSTVCRPSRACRREPEGPGELNLVKGPFYRCHHQPSKPLMQLLCRSLQAPSSPTQTHPHTWVPAPPEPPHSSHLLQPSFSARSTPDCPSLISPPVLSLSLPGPSEGPPEDCWEQGTGQERPHLDSWPEAPSPKPAITLRNQH